MTSIAELRYQIEKDRKRHDQELRDKVYYLTKKGLNMKQISKMLGIPEYRLNSLTAK